MKKLLSIALVFILAASFMLGVMASDSRAEEDRCHYKCDGIYWMKCCPKGYLTPNTHGTCVWTGIYCA